jgi:UDP-glucose 4-epimerase
MFVGCCYYSVMSHPRTILITGGAGFIGSNLARSLISSGHNVVILDDFSTGLRSNIEGLDLEVIDGTIFDKETVSRAAKTVDLIIHLAARGSVPRSLRNPQSTFDVNVQGTLNICEIARERDLPIVFSSSSSVYGGNTNRKKIEREWLSPLSPYAASKLSGEALLLSYAESFGIPTAIFRLFNVYGPGQRPEHQYSAVIPKWLWAAIQNEELKVFGDGRTTRDFTFIDNVVEIFTRTALEERFFDGVTNLAFGKPVTLLEVLSEIQKINQSVNFEHYETRKGDIASSENGSKRLIELYPDVTPIELSEGIKMTNGWLHSARHEIETKPLVVSDD